MNQMNNESRPVALCISGVKKMYKLGQIGGGTLQADLQSWWAKKRGKEDPNAKIGQEERLVGQTFMALNGVDFTVYQGEAVGIIGGNGAGKSTLLKLISQVTAPTEGQIELFGRVASMLEVGTGFNGEMTGRENVYMNGAILGMTKAEIDKKMEDIIEFSEVRDFIDTPVKRYSSGMYVKLAFSVAAHLDSEIMIMDEVLAVGDMAFQMKCLNKMREAAKQDDRTVLYVSHNMNTIRKLCDRCIVLDKGKVVYEGDVDEAINIYLGHYSDDSLSYDFSGIQRNRKQNDKCRLLGLEILDRESNIVKRGEKLRVLLHSEINASMKNLRFRFEIVNSEGVTVGSTLSDKGIDVVHGTLLDVKMDIDTTNFATDTFHAIALPYEYDTAENQIHTDRVDPAFFFKIISNEEDNVIWENKYWGSIRLNDSIINNYSVYDRTI